MAVDDLMGIEKSAQRDFKSLELDIHSPSFLALLFTQWLTAINDNAFRWLVIGIGKDYVTPSNVGNVLMAGSACFLSPYLFLAAPAGYLADRFCKRNVIVACKIAEIFVMALGVAAIWIGSFTFLLVVVALMGAQSALFSPAKMGTIPELLGTKKISAANGWFGLSTVTATIIGMAIGGWLADVTAPKGVSHLWMSGVVLVGIAAVGTAISLVISGMPAANPAKRFPWRAATQTFRDLRTLFTYRALFVVSLGKVFFWSVGLLTQLNIDQFSNESGSLVEFDRTPLLVAMVFGVGFGSVLAGFLSAGRIELGMLWVGTLGITVFGLLVYTVPSGFMDFGIQWNDGFVLASIYLMLLGVSAGIFDVPLSAYIQHKSPREKRGSILAANNFMLFSGMLVASLVFALLRAPTFDGSMNEVAGKNWEPVTTEQRSRIDQITADFQTAWERSTHSSSTSLPSSGDSPQQSLPNETQQPDSHKQSDLVAEDRQTFADDGALGEASLPRLEEYMSQGSSEIEKPLFASLLWVELDQRRKLDLEVVRNSLFERFAPEDAGSLEERLARKHLVKDVYEQSNSLPLLTSRQIFLVIGLSALPVLLFVLYRLPQASVRFVGWSICRLVYKVRIHNEAVIPENSGAVIVVNRCSTLDRIILLLSTGRKLRWITNEPPKEHDTWGKFWGTISIAGGPTKQQLAFADARKALKRGEILAIAPEPSISSSGQLQAFDEEYLRLISLSPVPIIPVYLDEFWGSIFTYQRGRYFWKLSRRLRRPFTIYYGQPLRSPGTIHELRQAVQDLGASTVNQRTTPFLAPAQLFIRRCKQRKFLAKAGDSSGVQLTGGNLLLRTLVLRRLLRRHVLTDDREKFVGVLLPPSVPGVVVNMALALDKRIVVNLNYSASAEVLNHCIKQSGLKRVLTSERVMSKLDLKLDAEIVHLESIKDKATLGDKLGAAINAFLRPASMLEASLNLKSIVPDDLLTVIFTSGSTGVPKGVMLTQRNVASNVQAIQDVIHLVRSDTIVGILPFFHSFGYTVTLWGSMGLDVGACYHFTPLDGKQVGKLVREFKGTCLLATPTFLRNYLRRTPAEDFESLSIVVAGAEKLPKELCDAFERKFGVRPVEGYGTTELSPLVSVNVPPSRSTAAQAVDCREGSVGRPIPNVAAKIVDLETGQILGVEQSGMLWIKGPNVMRGYLGRQDLTNEVVVDGWYKTGDVAMIDKEGFIIITGRESRFSKIGGEMVPHILIEETLAKIIGADEEEGLKAVVTAVPDERKGERLVVIHTPLSKSIDELVSAMMAEGLPNIYIPGRDCFLQVEEIPVLGTGKMDLHAMRALALNHFSSKLQK